MDVRIFDHWPDYPQSRRWPYRSRNAGRNIVAHTSSELWLRIAGLSVLYRRSQVPIRLRWRLRYCPTIASSASRAFDRNYQGYPKLSPLMGTSLPRFGIVNHRHAAPRQNLAWLGNSRRLPRDLLFRTASGSFRRCVRSALPGNMLPFGFAPASAQWSSGAAAGFAG